MRSSSTASPAKCNCARSPTSRNPIAKRRGCARAARISTRRLRDTPSVTRDGVAVGLHMNAGLVVDLPHLDESGAQSIGLFRTELQFMLALRFPRLSAQERSTGTVLDAAGERPVTFRTLDIGGDKVLPYMKGPEEENPALGWRAIRIGLDKPALLRTQMRAMLRAGAGRSLAHHAADGLERRRIRRRARAARARARFRRSLRPRASGGAASSA